MSLPKPDHEPTAAEPELALPEDQNDGSTSEPFQVAPVSAPSHDEPVVTRRELWSYYRVYHISFLLFGDFMKVFALVYHFGNNVRFSILVRYPEHGILVLILDTCVQYTGTWT